MSHLHRQLAAQNFTERETEADGKPTSAPEAAPRAKRAEKKSRGSRAKRAKRARK